ncbi:maleylpyruvate isomerase N-terminal domain-containing protein [Streptomyces ossamyceticus]
MDLFPRSWTAVAGLPDEDFARPSGCAGRLVRDLVRHPAVDAQDVLIPGDADRRRAGRRRGDLLGQDARTSVRRRPVGRADRPSRRRVRGAGSAQVPPRRRGLRDGPRRRTRRPGPPGEHPGQGAHRRRPPHRVRPGVDPAPPGPGAPPAGRSGAARRGTWPTTARCWSGSPGRRSPCRSPTRTWCSAGKGRWPPTEAERASLGEGAERLPFVIG